MIVVRDNLWLCADCMPIAVNGGNAGDFYGYEPAEAERRRLAVRAGLKALGPHLVPNFDSESGEGCEDFMRAPVGGCDCCGSQLSGAFHRFAVLAPEHPEHC